MKSFLISVITGLIIGSVIGFVLANVYLYKHNYFQEENIIMKKEKVSFGVKYNTGSIESDWDSENPVDGRIVFNALMKDAKMQWNWRFDRLGLKYGLLGCFLVDILKFFGVEDYYRIPGDRIIWYLGSSEKFGSISYKDKTWIWNFGTSSFDIVRGSIEWMYVDGFFTSDQYHQLCDAIEEGRKIDDAYKIGDYLMTKSSWFKKWEKPKPWREDSAKYFNTVKKTLEDKGFEIQQWGGVGMSEFTKSIDDDPTIH